MSVHEWRFDGSPIGGGPQRWYCPKCKQTTTWPGEPPADSHVLVKGVDGRLYNCMCEGAQVVLVMDS